MAKHTKGPWQLIQHSAEEASVRTGGGCVVSGVYGGFLPPSDARLIAAAPELLEALQAIVARVNGEFDHPALMRLGPLMETSDDILSLAAPAIAKAEGGANG